MDHQIRRLLQQGIDQLGLNLSDSEVVQLLDYIQEFQRWNKMHNLSAIHSLEESVSLHLLDSLAVLNSLDGYLKDKEGKIQLPLVMFRRNSIAKNDSVRFLKEEAVTYPTVRKYSKKKIIERKIKHNK